MKQLPNEYFLRIATSSFSDSKSRLGESEIATQATPVKSQERLSVICSNLEPPLRKEPQPKQLAFPQPWVDASSRQSANSAQE